MKSENQKIEEVGVASGTLGDAPWLPGDSGVKRQ